MSDEPIVIEANDTKAQKDALTLQKKWPFARLSGLYLRSAWWWIPKIRVWILFCLGASMLFSVASTVSILTRPSAMVFFALPDGTIVCPSSLIEGGTRREIRNEDEYRYWCHRVAPTSGFASPGER